MFRYLLQFIASIRRIFIEKRRNIRVTTCEYLSHFIIFLVLIAGFNLSVVKRRTGMNYAKFEVNIPPEFTNEKIINETTLSYAGLLYTLDTVLAGPLPIPTFDEFNILTDLVSSSSLNQYNGIISQTTIGSLYGNLLQKGELHFAPEGPEVNNLIGYLKNNTLTFNSITYYIHESEKAGIDYILNHLEHRALALIVLRDISYKKVNYVIRQNYTTLPNTNSLVDFVSIGLDTSYQSYLLSGFLTLQRTVDEWVFNYLNITTNQCQANPQLFLTPYPTIPYDQNPFYPEVGFLLGLAFALASLYAVSRTVKSIVEEKENKVKELMKILGLNATVYQTSWIFVSFVLFFWIAISETVLSSTFLPNSNKGILFIYFFLFALSEITFSFLLSVWFSNSKLASIVAPVALFAAILPKFIYINTNSNERVSQKYLVSLLSPTAFSFGADLISDYEYAGKGIQLSNIFEGKFNFFSCLLMMFVDIFLYGILAWYFDLVVPQEYGTPEHPLFIFNYKYWCRDIINTFRKLFFKENEFNYEQFTDLLSSGLYNIPELMDQPSDNIEKISDDFKTTSRVLVSNLRKEYNDGKIAVKNVSFALLEGQITCLLGANGAGKTTTISVLTGLVQASKGNINIYGNDLQKNLKEIREITGICPQQNVLFPSLTVVEHLIFFGCVKGIFGGTLHIAVDKVISEVGLNEKRNALSSSLSGGMKRKLCLAIAFIGDPKFVLLDEPTSGMDPHSRRSTWNILQKSKANRVILLTTHFMDEADTLADRLIILSEGRLRCSGSSLFLKTRYGAGYNLTLSKVKPNVTINDSPEEPASLLNEFDSTNELIISTVQEIIPSATVQSIIASEMVFGLPLNTVSLFSQLFSKIQQISIELGISSFGISITSLEQVFIRLAEDRTSFNDDFEHDEINDKASNNIFVQWIKIVYDCILRSSNRIRNLLLHQISQQDNHIVVPYNNILSDKPLVNIEEEKVDNNKQVEMVELKSNDSNYKVIDSNEVIDGKHTVQIDNPKYSNQLFVQTKELIRKRFLSAIRDKKGLFFQIVFPALQILLILLILTIKVNPSGHTLRLQLRSYIDELSTHPVLTFISNNIVSKFSDYFYIGESIDEYILKSIDYYTNSYNYSNFILDNIDIQPSNQYGTILIDDLVNFNVTVDWLWVYQSLVYIDENPSIIPKLSQSYNNIYIGNNITLDINQFISNSNFNLSNILNSVNISSNININQFDIKNPNIYGDLSITSISLNLNDLSLTLNGLSVTIFNITLTNINVVFTLHDIVNIIPHSGVDVYYIPYHVNYNILHNSSSPHAIALYHGQFIQNLFRSCSPYDININTSSRLLKNEIFELDINKLDNDGRNIKEDKVEVHRILSSNSKISNYVVKNHPLPITAQESLEIEIILSLFTSLFILVPLCYIPSVFCAFIVQERATKCKHLQIVSGVSAYLYWVATYSWDIFIFLFIELFIIVILLGFGKKYAGVFIGTAASTGSMVLLLLTYGASSIAISYLYSLLFDNYSTAQISIMAINFTTGFLFVLAYFIMISVSATRQFGLSIVHIFRFFPPYNIGEGLVNLSTSYFENKILGGNSHPLDFNITGRNIVFMFAEAVGYFGIMLLLESPIYKKIRNYYFNNLTFQAIPLPPPRTTPEDEDVTNEDISVRNSSIHEYILTLKDIIKTYPALFIGGQSKHAVRGVTLGIRKGERFGLLGINGAGKTTILSILTGDIQQTSGEVSISGLKLSEAITMIGYCPQVDPLLELMTGTEVLWFYGRIRGIGTKDLGPRVESLIDSTGLRPFADRLCGRYSGGNKRKLSLAIALIGDPKVLLLDEPSTGMDPESRRKMWNVIENLSLNRSVILVSHSMEECEALTTRIGILVSGRLQCLGSSQHLKNKFGAGYQIEIRCKETSTNDITNEEPIVIPNLQHILPHQLLKCLYLLKDIILDYEILETHGYYIRIKTFNNIDLVKIFECIENHKIDLNIIDYSVCQSTLEQIFIKFAKDQEEEKATN